MPIQAVHKMRPIATDVARSVVCVSVCWSHGCAVQKPLNQSRCRLGCRLMLAQGNVLNGFEIITRKEAICGFSGPLKNSVSLCCGVYSKRDHSILNNGVTARLLQPTAVLQTVRCYITLSPVKNPPLCDAAFRQNSLTTC